MHYLLKYFLGYKPIVHRNMKELKSEQAQKSILCVYKKR